MAVLAAHLIDRPRGDVSLEAYTYTPSDFPAEIFLVDRTKNHEKDRTKENNAFQID
jgi:hypothetical protein